TIKVTLANQGSFQYEKGISLERISHDFQGEQPCKTVAAIVDNQLRELNYTLYEDCDVKFIDECSPIGARIYQRSLSFVFIRACMELFSGCRVSVEHSLSKGLYCEIHYKREINEKDTIRIEQRMREIIEEDVPLTKGRIPVDEAIDIFKEYGQMGKMNLMKY